MLSFFSVQANCVTRSTIYEVKELIVLFNQTLQGYGYNMTRLFDILLEVRDRYTAVLVMQAKQDFLGIFQHDDYTPIQAKNEEEFRIMLDTYPFRDRVLMEAPYPKIFPFSSVVPAVYLCIKKFIDNCVKFVEDLDLSHTEVDEMVRRSTNHLLSKTLSGKNWRRKGCSPSACFYERARA